MGIEPVHVSFPRLGRAVSNENESIASTASTSTITFGRCSSSSARRMSDWSEAKMSFVCFERAKSSAEQDKTAGSPCSSSSAVQMRDWSEAKMNGGCFERAKSSAELLQDKIAGSPWTEEFFGRQRPARALLPEWPADVDDDVFASSKRNLLSFDQDPTTLPRDLLCHLALEMFVSAGLPAGLAKHRVRRFILAVRASMLDNPYHNFYHVFDVMQTTNALATATGTMARLDAWERFALLSAALCHDMEHPAVTSQFLCKAADATHGTYRDITFRDVLLEKHHALRALELMCDSDVGILEGLSSEQYYQFRSSVFNTILATDMDRHVHYIHHLQEFAARRAENPAAEMDKQLAMELMVKCADISNVCKPAAVARRWALRITDEFYLQGDAERALDMKVTPICDRFATSRVDLQIGFIDYVASRLFTLLATAFPQEGLEAPLEQLRNNLRNNRALYDLCSDVELERSRDWEDTGRSVAPASLRAESQQLSSDEDDSFW
ncbi:hypothetical protein T484DRAFT_1895259 [Baffinella frigidus]|nr:hypothetical protein T484DRAFT_1895259 [Cryptophyta sp. CCMP2293]